MNERDAYLIRCAADPDRPLSERHCAFDQLCARYVRVVLGLAAGYASDRAQAEDIAQSALIAAWVALPALRAPEAFPRWLARLVRTAARRGRCVERIGLDTVAEPLGPDPAMQYEAVEMLDVALSALSPAERICLVLFYREGYSREEIATRTGVSLGTVKKRLAAARKAFRNHAHLWNEELSMETQSVTARVAAFTRLFSGLIDQGVSLVRALDELAAGTEESDLAAAIREINKELLAGQVLSVAMGRYPRYFSPGYVRAVRRGEICGRLEVSLRELVEGWMGDGALPDAPEMDRVYIAIAAATGGQLPWSPAHLLFGLATADCAARARLPHPEGSSAPLAAPVHDGLAAIDRDASRIAAQQGKSAADSLDYLQAIHAQQERERFRANGGA